MTLHHDCITAYHFNHFTIITRLTRLKYFIFYKHNIIEYHKIRHDTDVTYSYCIITISYRSSIIFSHDKIQHEKNEKM
jgi:hypothetical protein